MTIRVRAPATTANLGPGFDCAAAALDLWNDLDVEEGGGDPDPGNLVVRAFALLADPAGRTFRCTDRIPRERGLGSSAAAVAAGLVAGAIAAGRARVAEELLAVGVELEGHADNLAAALVGGVCLTTNGRIARLADAAPAVPIALVAEGRQRTDESRAALPASISHRNAALSAAGAALLGAALASGSEELFAAALAADRLHEPYRQAGAPLLTAVRERLPAGALGATLSGSGPTVIVWVRHDTAQACAAELGARYPQTTVLALPVSAHGAGPR